MTKPATLAKSTPVAPGIELTSRVQALLTASPKLTALFEGRGKTAIGPDGRRLDTSSSGYDFSLALGRRRVSEAMDDPSGDRRASSKRSDATRSRVHGV